MFPSKLIEIQNFLLENRAQLKEYSRDGRINSALNEDDIINIINNDFKINLPNARAWFDFSLEENGEFYPVNIKVTTTHTTDNLNCKLGIYYALTGNIPIFNNINWEQYFYNLKKNLKENCKDYYFLIINKDNTQDIFVASLKSLNKISPNGNNLPFQAKWDENRCPISRDFKEAKDFIMKCFANSLKLRADAYFHFKKYFNEYA
ncbi:restriction endonuclease [Campylobacter sp. IFREMER_LSEM_CL1846]|uniref:restriction endonuclease n=1 Tax=unclassified Campylobacter TaxID=2593542 RepID=UPI0012881256|nr:MULTISPECIES: restriction endonuclease [unclassified Campylobacter]EAJ5677550.1 restriction endonuclease [Campylobacter lari]EAK0444396.1 restriction endonuclease [Campylobacter lari]EAK9943098.1 restriction endonuclease [Campylobacter lari]MCV3433912.1 restriction endonuclease [Campylobacter sp. IFREMER_LSEM_CL1846]MCV3530472.1 restriction endonuclease [Campylobacter sp. CNRCH_2007_0968H]